MAGIVEAQQRLAALGAMGVERARLGRGHVGAEAGEPDDPRQVVARWRAAAKRDTASRRRLRRRRGIAVRRGSRSNRSHDSSGFRAAAVGRHGRRGGGRQCRRRGARRSGAAARVSAATLAPFGRAERGSLAGPHDSADHSAARRRRRRAHDDRRRRRPGAGRRARAGRFGGRAAGERIAGGRRRARSVPRRDQESVLDGAQRAAPRAADRRGAGRSRPRALARAGLGCARRLPQGRAAVRHHLSRRL